MADTIYIPLSQYVQETLIPADLVNTITGGFLDYIAYEDGHIYAEGGEKNARLFLTVMKPLEVEFISGIKAGIAKGRVELEFTDNADEWSFRAAIEKFHFEIAILKVQQDITTMLLIRKATAFQEFEFSLRNIVIGSFTANEVSVWLLREDDAQAGKIIFDITWDIIKNRLQNLPSNVPKPNNDDTEIDVEISWDESDTSKSVDVHFQAELAELANPFFDFLPEDVRPEVLSWQLGIDVKYEGQTNKSGYEVFMEETPASQLTGDIYAAVQLLLPDKLSSLGNDVIELRIGDNASVIRARLAINDINSGDTKFQFEVEDPVSIIIHVDEPGAGPIKISCSRFLLDKSSTSGSLKLQGYFVYGNLKGSSSFEFIFSPTSSTWKGNLVLGYYLDNFQVETELQVDFGTAQTAAEPVTIDDSSSNVKGRISFSKIKIGNDNIYAKLVDASFGFDYTRAAGKPVFKIQTGIDILFQLSTAGLDGFLTKVLPTTPIQFPFQKKFEWTMDQEQAASTTGGTTPPPGSTTTAATASGKADILNSLQQTTTSQRTGGGLNLSFLISIQKDIFGVIRIESMEESIALNLDGITNTLVLNGGITIGPLAGIITGIGVAAEFNWKSPQKNLGFVDLRPRIVGPSGIGLSLDTSVVKAGGFLSIKPDEYIGALELEIKAISLAIKAIAIINTKLPGGQEGFSLLVIITAEFNPIQLSYGFTLNGFGGLFGYNRSFQADELRMGLKTKALDSILFPKNVIANINKIVTDLKKVFPMGNNFLVGPMIKIGWGGSIVTAEIGILVQVPNPIVIAILGIIRLQLPDPEEAVLKLQINFLGVIDFGKKMLSLDASLSDSRILTFTLTGDIAFRLGWGSPALFIFSSGGFHPDFKEAPVELQRMERLGLMIINEPDLKLGAGTYFALTSNTVQIGALIRFYAKYESFKVVAEVGFDALIQFNPFFFSIAIYMTGRVTGPMIDVVIEVKGNLAGPNPWHLWGHAMAKLMFFEISIPFDKTFGEPIEELSAGSENVLDLLKQEIPKSENWKAFTVLEGVSRVSIREIQSATNMIAHPNTVLSFTQRVVPLEVVIENFSKKSIDGANNFTISAALAQPSATITETPLYDSFAPGNFFVIPKDQQLSRPSFEKMKSGKEFRFDSFAATAPQEVPINIDYEIMYVRNKTVTNEGNLSLLSANEILLAAGGGAAAKSKLSAENTRTSFKAPPAIKIMPPGYVVVNKTNHNKSAPETFDTQAEAFFKQQEFDENETLILSTQEL